MLFILILLQFRLPITEYHLKNGMKLLVYEDHSVPIVSTQIWYRTGSYNDPKGQSGLSHFLEHMSFKGTRRYGPKDYSRIIESNGGEDNAFTSHHYIAYYANLHKDRYKIELDLEADRMVNLVLDSLELERERGVVLEELRLGENDPLEYLWDQVRANGFQQSPYQIPIVGWETDVESIKREEMMDYYRRYFNPANAILVIAGDIDPVRAREDAEDFFGRFEGSKTIESNYRESDQQGERRFVIERGLDSPILMLGYHTPPVTDAEYYAVELLFSILGRGRLSRLYKDLVYERGLASRIGVYVDDNRYPGLSNIYAYPASGIKVDSLEQAIYETTNRLRDSIDLAELKRVQNQTIAQFVYGRDGVFRMGVMIGWAEIVAGSYHYIEEYPARIGRVTIDEVQNAIDRYLDPKNRTVGIIR